MCLRNDQSCCMVARAKGIYMQLTSDFFNALVIIVILTGLIPAFLRLRADLRRPLPPPPPAYRPFNPDDDTQPHETS